MTVRSHLLKPAQRRRTLRTGVWCLALAASTEVLEAKVPLQPPTEPAAEAAPIATTPSRPGARDAQPPLVVGASRRVPAYAKDSRAGSPLWWGPRVMLFPLYAVSEYVVRRPLRATVAYAEEHYWRQHLIEWFTFGPDRQAGIIPAAYFDLGFTPRAGFTFYWNRAFHPASALRLRAETAGVNTFRASFGERLRLAGASSVRLQASFERRPDLTFWQPWPATEQGAYRYGADTLRVSTSYGRRGWRSSRWSAGLTLLDRQIDASPSVSGGALLGQGVAAGDLSVPPAGIAGYTSLSPWAQVTLDSRTRVEAPVVSAQDLPPIPGTGYSASASVSFAEDLLPERATAPRWVTYRMRAGAHLDLNGRRRTLHLGVQAEGVTALGGGVVPFTELVSLGGGGPMAGLRSRRLIGDTTAAARLEYRWPIWVYLDAVTGVAAGAALGKKWDGLEWGDLRGSADFGIRGNALSGIPFTLLLGAGTKPFREGAALEDLRVVARTSTAW